MTVGEQKNDPAILCRHVLLLEKCLVTEAKLQ